MLQTADSAPRGPSGASVKYAAHINHSSAQPLLSRRGCNWPGRPSTAGRVGSPIPAYAVFGTKRPGVQISPPRPVETPGHQPDDDLGYWVFYFPMSDFGSVAGAELASDGPRWLPGATYAWCACTTAWAQVAAIEFVDPDSCPINRFGMSKPRVQVVDIAQVKVGWIAQGIIRRQIACERCGAVYTQVVQYVPIECATFPCPSCGHGSKLITEVLSLTAIEDETSSLRCSSVMRAQDSTPYQAPPWILQNHEG